MKNAWLDLKCSLPMWYAWFQSMTQKLLDIADHNVVVVDWSGGCLPPYVQATANTRLVGLELAYFINYLKVFYFHISNIEKYVKIISEPLTIFKLKQSYLVPTPFPYPAMPGSKNPIFLQNNTGLNPGDVHIIGHSLGSHIAGYAGERVTGNFGRFSITNRHVTNLIFHDQCVRIILCFINYILLY